LKTQDLVLNQISEKITMNRNSVAKYLDIMLMTHQVEMLQHGMSKIFRVSKRTGIPTMLDLSSDYILVFDRALKIVQVNDNYLKFSGLKREDVIGMHPASGRLPVVSMQKVVDKIKEAGFGTDTKTEVRIVEDGRELFFDVRVTPAFFNDGKNGITVLLEDVTEHKKSDILLKESEADFRTLFGLSSVGTAVYESAGHLIHANEAFLDLFGVMTRKEIGSINLFSLSWISPESIAFLGDGKKVFLEPVIDFDQMKVRHGIGTKRTGRVSMEINITPISLRTGGAQNGYLLQVHEVDARITSIMDSVPDVVARFNRDLIYLYTNAGIETLTGIPPKCCIGRTNRELGVSGDFAVLMDKGIGDVFRMGLPVSFEFPFPCMDGLHYYQTDITPETGKTGEIVSVIAVTRDITKIRNAVTDLRENRRVLEEILSCIDEAVILLDPGASTICFVNKAAEKVFGSGAGDFPGKDPALLLGYPTATGEYLTTLRAAFRDTGSYEAESMLKRNNGQEFPSKQQYRPIFDDDGRILNIVAVIRDVSGQKPAEEPEWVTKTIRRPTQSGFIHGTLNARISL
jgi:PAS domain S-box-containing protein